MDTNTNKKVVRKKKVNDSFPIDTIDTNTTVEVKNTDKFSECPWIGNFYGYQQLLQWLQKSFTKRILHMDSVCIIFGGPGIGKTYGIREACKTLNKELHIIDSQKIANFKECKDHLCKMCQSNITSQFYKETRAHQVVCLEELETLFTMDRTFANSLQKLIESGTLPHIPIILTCNNSERKKMLELFEGATCIDLYIPSESDILLFLRKKASQCKANILLSIAEKSNGNISTAIHMLDMEIRHLNKRNIDKNDNKKPDKNSNKNDKDKSKNVNELLYVESSTVDKIPTLSELYTNPNPIYAYKVFMEDPWLHPLRFHENLGFELKQRKGVQTKKYQKYTEFMESLCIWDYFMSRYDDPLIPIEYISHSVGFLKGFEKKKISDPSQENFTKMFSHLSLEKKNQISIFQNHWENIGSYHKSLFENIMKGKKFSL